MSIEKRHAKAIFEIFETLVGAGKGRVSAGDIAAVLRERNSPMGVWQIRGILSDLGEAGLIRLDAETAAWELAEPAADQQADAAG